MRDNSKVTITMAEYTRLIRADILLDTMTNRAKMEKYFSHDDIKAMLGIPTKEDDDE